MQAELVCLSDVFRGTTILKALLQYLLSETLAGREGELSQYSIGSAVFDLPGNFSPESNPVVRVTASRLRRALFSYYAGDGAGDPIVIELPKGAYALRFAYRAVDSPLRRPILGLMEFEGLDLDSEWVLFPLLLAEELSVAMSGIGLLQLMGPFSRRLLNEERLEPVSLGKRYAVDLVLDGSVQRKAEELVIRTRLLDGTSGVQIWARKDVIAADRAGFSAFEESLMRELAVEVGADHAVSDIYFASLARVKPVHQWSVMEAVLCGRMYFKDFSAEMLEKSLAALRRAVVEFPEEALPHATLAVVLGSACFETFWTGPVPCEEVAHHARLADELDPQSPWSVIALETSAVIRHRDDELKALADTVGELGQTSALLVGSTGIWMCYRKLDVTRALAMIREAMERNPHYPRLFHLGPCLHALECGDLDGALREIDAYGSPQDRCDALIRGAVASFRGDQAEARIQWKRLLRNCPDFALRGYDLLQRFFHDDYCQLICGAFNEVGAGIEMPVAEVRVRELC